MNDKIENKNTGVKNSSDYIAISVNHVLFLKSSPCDVFIRVLRKNTEDRYIKRIFAGDNFTSEEIKKYEQSGVDYFYVQANYLNTFQTQLFNTVNEAISDKNSDEESRLKGNQVGMELVTEQLFKVGLTEETIKLSSKVIKSIVLSTRGWPKILNLAKSLLKNKASYRYKHVQLLTFINLFIMKNIDWGTDELMEKMAFVTFFHDISLQTDEECKIKNIKDLWSMDISKERKEYIKAHALKSAELIISFPKAPMGADIIMKQHHGSLNGIGYPDIAQGNISPASIVFILAEEMTDMMIEKGEDLNKQEFFKYLNEKYTTTRFKKIINVMEEILSA